ncbi:MAG: ATP-binding cassette domain-containing protein [Candidatus Hodarchaeales archaeon]
MAILEVEGLTTHYFLKESRVRAADNITFSVRRGTTLGLAGESGCGKTTVALSLMRLLPAAGRIIKGKINLDGQDLMRLSREEMRKARWKELSYIFQYAMNAFNPVMNVGEQIAEVIIEKEGSSKFASFRGQRKKKLGST